MRYSSVSFAVALTLFAWSQWSGARRSALAPLTPRTVQGRLQSPIGPVAGAPVRVRGPVERALRADASGRFDITLPPGEYQLEVEFGGRPQAQPLTVSAEGVELEVHDRRPESTVRGRVFGLRGRPVPGAQVSAHLGLVERAYQAARGARGEGVRSYFGQVQADHEGRFVLDGLPAGAPIELHGSAPSGRQSGDGWAPARLGEGGVRIDLRPPARRAWQRPTQRVGRGLRPSPGGSQPGEVGWGPRGSAQISGRIGAGQGHEGAVYAVDAAGRLLRATSTSTSGGFSLSALPAGRVSLSSRPPGRFLQLDLREGERAQVDMRPPKERATLSVQIRDAAERRLDMEVFALAPWASSCTAWSSSRFDARVRRGPTGRPRAALEGLPLGSYLVCAVKQEGARTLTASQTVSLTETATVVLRLHEGAP